MTEPVKFASSEITLTTANTVGNSGLVRIVNAGANDVVITVKTSAGDTISTFTLGNKDTEFSKEYLVKGFTDTIEVSSGTSVIKAVASAYR